MASAAAAGVRPPSAARRTGSVGGSSFSIALNQAVSQSRSATVSIGAPATMAISSCFRLPSR